ncbi:MAG: AI-2E family transporter [Phycisphaerae bacterium]|nr:AI-2E family transporter [Phycisphaerae bacterium]
MTGQPPKQDPPESGEQLAPPGESMLPHSGRFLISAAAFVVVIAGIKAASNIVIPLLLAVFLAIISTPTLFWMKKRGIPSFLAILIISLVILAIGLLIGTVLATSITDFTGRLPEYATRLDEHSTRLITWIDEQGVFSWFEEKEPDEEEDEASSEPVPAPAPPPPLPRTAPQEPIKNFLRSNVPAAVNVMRDLLDQLLKLLKNGFLIYLLMVFILMEASALPSKIREAINSQEAFENLCQIANNVKRYLALKTAVSLLTGVLVMNMLMILNVSYPVVWGLIAFLLNFVPNVGSIIAAVPAIILALVQHSPSVAGLTFLGYMVINVSIGNFLEPRLMGQRLGLSPLVVFVSLIFWGWVLGPMGMLLSVPLTMTVKIALQTNKETRWMAMLLGSYTPSAPDGK